MSALADALEAYEFAIACGADSLLKAERLQDVINAGRADIARTYEKEEA